MNRGTIGVLAAAALLAACGDDGDPAGASGDQLSRAEALVVVEALALATDESRTAVIQQGVPESAGAPPSTITVDHTSTHPCPVGGNVAIALDATLTYDEEAQTLGYDAEGSLTHDACAFTHEAVTITVTGDPNVSFATHAHFEAGVADPITETVEGAFLWSTSDERSGRCVVQLEKVTDLVAKRHTLQGEACGHTIDRTITWT